MPIEFNVTVDTKKAESFLTMMFNRVSVAHVTSVVAQRMTAISHELTDVVRSNYLRTILKERTGNLVKNTVAIPTTTTANRVVGGVDIGKGLVYTRVHVGPEGQVTTIRPKTAKSLTIPLPPALGPQGVKKYPSAWQYADLFPITSKAGNRLLVQKEGDTLIPFFLLVQQVQIKARIHPEQILYSRYNWIVSELYNAVKGAIVNG